MTQDNLLNTISDTFSVYSRTLHDFSDMWVVDQFTYIYIYVQA